VITADPVCIERAAPADRRRWDAYVAGHPFATAAHWSGWRDVIAESFGHRTFYLMARQGATVVGVLPLVSVQSRMFGRSLVSMPFLDYGGVLADDDAVESALIGEAVTIARDLGADHLELRHATKKGAGLISRTHKVSMRLPLPKDPGRLWNGFSPKLRSQIRRPQKDGCVARVGGREELDAFYRVFAENMRDLGTPVYGKRFFRRILERLPDVLIGVVHHGATPIAAGLLLRVHDRVHIQWASSLKRYNRMSPNMLLYWTLLEQACQQGCEEFDFGRSSPDSGTFRFKEQWGAAPAPLSWDYWLRPGASVPELDATNPRYAFAVRVWQHLPLVVANSCGPWIRKYVSA